MLSEIHLSDGRPLCICEYPADADSQSWIVFLPGSGAEFWDFSWSERRALLSAFSGAETPHLLMINKPGIDLEGTLEPQLYEHSFRRSRRISDYREVLKQIIPADDRIFLIGFSEGAYLAPDIALGDSRIQAGGLLSGGTRSWLDEEIYKSNDPRTLRETLNRVAKVYLTPKSTRAMWHRVSHATWTSYDTDATRESLGQLRLPIFAAFGSEDRMIDVASALEDLGTITKARVVTRVYDGVDHTLEHRWISALRACGEFFKQIPWAQQIPPNPLDRLSKQVVRRKKFQLTNVAHPVQSHVKALDT